MKTEEIKELFTRFESIVCEYNGVECWSARELYPLLGYTQWRNFLPAIEKAKASCQNAGEDTAYHFADVRKMVLLGSRSEREIDNILLTRYACYLIGQNGAPSGVLYERGIDNKGFATIRSKGDKALFRIDTKLLKRKLGVPESRPLADFLPTISIKAKDFAAEMTSVNVQQKDLYGQSPIEHEHVDNNLAVRDMLVNRGIFPEHFPAGEDIKKVEKRMKKETNKLSDPRKKKK